MAFQHFHRNRNKYMAFFFVATLFSLFTFNVTSAILSFFSGAFGGTHGAAFRFVASDGRQIGIDADALHAAEREIPGLARMGFDQGLANDPRQSWLPHLILLAEADALGIEIPVEVAEKEIDSLKQRLQLQASYIAMMRKQPEHKITEAEYLGMLRSNNLTEASLVARVRESLKIDAYVRSMAGLEIQNPEQVVDCFKTRNELVTAEYVAFSFDHFKEELRKAPPSDADLETWFKALPQAVINSKYTREDRYTIDLATLDGDAWDATKVDAALLGTVADPTDDEVLAEAKRDPLRYGTKAPEKAADLTAEQRAKIVNDRKLKAFCDKAKAEFEAAVNALPPLDPAPPKEGEPAPAPKSDEQKKADEAARRAEEKRLFDETAKKYGFAVVRHVDQESKALGEIDPPKNVMLNYLVSGFQVNSKIVHSTLSLPARDNKWAFLFRVDEKKAREAKPFAEVKAEVLDQWIEEHGREKAEEAAQAFVDGVVAAARQKVPAERTAICDTTRDQRLAEVEGKKDATEETKKIERRNVHTLWIDDLQSAIGPAVSAEFAAAAQAAGLTVTKIGPQRRSVASSPYFRDRFSGAERFLWQQNGGDFEQSGGRLLGYAPGMMTNALVDEDGKACYVARVVERTAPKVEDMSPSDRDQAERENQQWMAQRRRVPYLNPFSYSALLARHKPEMLTSTRSSSQSSDGY